MKHQLGDAIFLGLSAFLFLNAIQTATFYCIILGIASAFIYAFAESHNSKTTWLFLLFISGLVIFNSHLNLVILILSGLLLVSYFLWPSYSTRQIPIVKNMVIAGVWSSLLLLFEWEKQLAFALFVLVFALSVVIDWGDKEKDPFTTIPKLISTRHTFELTLVLSFIPFAFLKTHFIFITIPFIVLLQWQIVKTNKRILRELPLFCFALLYWLVEKV